MTTTAARPQADDDNDWRHGPVAAPFNTAVVALFTTTLGKTLGMPPWVAFLATTVMIGAVIWAGLHRHPRPLSRDSIAYRVIAVTACGGWMWVHLATFPELGLSTIQTVILILAWPLTIVVSVGCIVTRRLPALLRFAVPAALVLFSIVFTLVLGGHVASWLRNVLFVTDPMPAGWAPVAAWLWQSLLQLVILAAPMAVIGRHTANREESAAEEAERAAAAATPQTSPAAKKFLKLVCDATGEYRTLPQVDRSVPPVKVPALEIVAVDPWKNGAGETYVLNLVNGKNTTVQSLRTHTTLWATKMNLDMGCGIEVLNDTESRGRALVKVNRVNVLKQLIHYPDLLPRSIMNALPLGVTRDGVEIGPYFRENSCFLWGQKGSGKTGTIFDIIAGGLQCTDTLVWVIDLNGGAAAKPFLRPWADGKTDRPCIDWVASTLPEVLAMTEVGLAIALDRKIHYADLKYEHNVNLMPVGNGEPGNPPPAILIVIDEGATVLGIGGGEVTDVAKQAKHNLNQIMDLARDAAVNIVFSGLRATADVADTAFKAGTSIRIGMRVTDGAELAHGFGRYDLNPADIPEKGSGFISTGHEDAGDEVQVFKAYFLDPKRNYDVAVTTTPWRPFMDDRGLQIGGARYANRWARSAARLWEVGKNLTQERMDELCSYGAIPATAAERAASASAVATAERQGPASGVDTAFFQPPTGIPGQSTFSDMMETARRSREKFQEGSLPDELPVTGPGQQPAGPPQPPADTGGDEPGDPDELADQPTEAEWEIRFRDLANRLNSPDGVLPDSPQQMPRNRMPIPVPPESEIAARPASREIVERIVRAHGPVSFGDLHKMLSSGGGWGPANPISTEALRKLLLKPNSKDPVEWLAPRNRGDKYNHRDNVK